MKQRPISAFILLLVALGAQWGCSSITSTHGQIVNEKQIGYLQPGLSKQDEVRQLLGSPSTIGTFNENRWYYVTETTENEPLNPNMLTSRRVVILEFDEDGVVQKILTRDEQDGKEVPFLSRSTPTQGQSLGIIDQMIQNLGVGR
jgi:outer membrane protein assembly factor BamE (lipoprotein component of BamABCDE complex)